MKELIVTQCERSWLKVERRRDAGGGWREGTERKNEGGFGKKGTVVSGRRCVDK